MTDSESDTYPVFAERSEIEMSSGYTAEMIIYYPGYNRIIEKQSRDRNAPFPLVIFSPGAGGGGVALYGNFVSDLASYGFVVAGVSWQYEENREEDVAHADHRKVIDHIKDLSETRTSTLHGLADTTNCGTYGHSRGGRAAFMASGIDSRINSVCAWMPTLNNASSVEQSSNKLLFSGEDDHISYPPIWTDPLYDCCDPLIVYVNVTDGDHTPNEEIHADITFKFFRYHLKGETSLESEVHGDTIKQRAKSGEFHLKMKTDDGEYDSESTDINNEEKDEEPLEEEPVSNDTNEDPDEKAEEEIEEEPIQVDREMDNTQNESVSNDLKEDDTDTSNELDNKEKRNESNILLPVTIAIILSIIVIMTFVYVIYRKKGVS